MYAFVYTLDGMTAADYAAVREELGAEPPPGLVLHIAGPFGSGYRYLDVWDSQEDWDRFHEDRLHAALERAGIIPAALDRIRVTTEPLESVVHAWGRALTPAVV